MNFIIIDLEMNEIDAEKYPDERKICKFEIMQIGAVKLDSNFVQIDEFNEYVKPQLNSIGQRYTELTGISDETVKNADAFSEVVKNFYTWCGDDYKIISWGNMDKVQVKNESELKGIKNNSIKYMIKNWEDFQADFSKILGIHKSVALKDAVTYAGIDIEGNLHDAYWDAKNTASLYRLARNKNALRKVMQPYVDSMKEAETMTYSLGDILSKLSI